MPHHLGDSRLAVGGSAPPPPPLFLLLLPLLPSPAKQPYTLLNFKRPPVITTQPESVTVFSVEDLVMSCEASGNPPPIFRWTKAGEEVSNGI
ncbi:neural cell adhesion molecule L1-like isoform X3 [Lates japonicus]|uniref:Neural cell adhesion molecule L1-like isoform X3 n=1 Tax=Lates japonicus TaxID=270547 RepID=A0AAD3QVS5_LATJO|nr:neural cell adhesion molecule L1-like isoform X3 [Lates japonicus]